MMKSSKFQPGRSGNPSGRPKGSRNKSGRLLDELEKDLPLLIGAAKRKALSGDTAALRLLLERLIPAKKMESSLVIIENLEQATTLTEKANVIIDAIATGKMPPDIGTNLITALGSTAKITELDALMKRVEALENDNQK